MPRSSFSSSSAFVVFVTSLVVVGFFVVAVVVVVALVTVALFVVVTALVVAVVFGFETEIAVVIMLVRAEKASVDETVSAGRLSCTVLSVTVSDSVDVVENSVI